MHVYRKNIPLDAKVGLKTARIILTVVFVFVSLGLTAGGIITLKVNESNQKRCTEEVTAKVVDYSEHSSSTNRNGRHHYSTTYAPVFEFRYEGKKYIVKSSVSSDPPEYAIGETVQLKIDPDHPGKIYDPNSKVASMVGYILIGVGILMMIIYVVVMIIMGKSLKKSARNEDDTETIYYNENQGE